MYCTAPGFAVLGFALVVLGTVPVFEAVLLFELSRPTMSQTINPIATAIATTTPILISDRTGLRPPLLARGAASDGRTSSDTKGDSTFCFGEGCGLRRAVA